MELTFVGKPDCHLCDEARAVVDLVLADLPMGAPSVNVVERSILDDSELFDRFVEEIPVILLDGAVHTIWRVDPVRLRSAILEAR